MGSVKIKTYSDPNNIFGETGLDKNCLHITPSQELIQGMKSIGVYSSTPYEGGWQPITVKALTTAFYEPATDNTRHTQLLRQMEVGELIAALPSGEEISIRYGSEEKRLTVDEHLKSSLKHSIPDLTASLQMLFALHIAADSIALSSISTVQLLLVYLYQQLSQNPDTAFAFHRLETRDAVRAALDTAVEAAVRRRFAASPAKQEEALKGYRDHCAPNVIIFDGIFRFTPELLAAIEDLKHAGYTIYFLFNYRAEPELRSFYQSWLNIYSLFGSDSFEVQTDMTQPVNSRNYALALALGAVAEGRYPANAVTAAVSIEKFENVMQFVTYTDHVFSAAEKLKSKDGKPERGTLYYMTEMFYSPSREANHLLRALHPEQFEDTKLLDYPLGRAFAAMVRMWNPETQTLEIKGQGDLADCVRGFPDADTLTNINTLGVLQSYLEPLSGMDDLIEMLLHLAVPDAALYQQLTGMLADPLESTVETACTELTHLTETLPPTLQTTAAFPSLSLHKLRTCDVLQLCMTLARIRSTARMFFMPPDGDASHLEFYSQVKEVIEKLSVNEVRDDDHADYAPVLQALLRKTLDTVTEQSEDTGQSLTVSAFNSQLPVMLHELLRITEHDSSSAKWIVHDLVQIDGDILVKPSPRIQRTNHFCFLSDQDLCADPNDRLPWPLDMAFFDSISLEEDAYTRFHIFCRSQQESRSFAKYALIYGILFSRDPVKLSYVKTVGDEAREPYYLFRMMGLHPHRVSYDTPGEPSDLTPYAYTPDAPACTPLESSSAKICPYRYVMDTLLQNGTTYTDRFSAIAYIKAQLVSRVLAKLTYSNDEAELLRQISNACHAMLYDDSGDFQQLRSVGLFSDTELHEILHDAAYQCSSWVNKRMKKFRNAVVPSSYFRASVSNALHGTVTYPAIEVNLEETSMDNAPQEIWSQSSFQNRYEGTVFQKGTYGEKHEPYKCALCSCKSLCPHGLTESN